MRGSSDKREQDIQREGIAYLNRFGFFFKDHNVGIRGRVTHTKGKADVIGVAHGLFFAFEFKTPGGKLSPHQAEFLSRVRAEGGHGEMVTCLNDIRTVLQRAGIDTGPH